MNIREMSALLATRAEDVARQFLPNGKRDGKAWVCGDVDGAEGRSMRLELAGDRAGLWIDFATGEGGDLIDLWAKQHNGSIPQALEEIKKYLGIRETEFVKPAKEYKRPPRPQNARKPQSAALEWLTKGRSISDAAIAAYRVAADAENVYFPFCRGDEVPMIKQRKIGTKEIRPTTADQEPCLFGWQAIPDSAREVTICEGEFDALSLWDYGFPALSVPFGGGTGGKHNWIETEFDRLNRFDKIYLAMDSDEAGEAAAKDIAKRLGLERCFIVNMPKKDANDCAQYGIPKSLIAKCFNAASTIDPSQLRNAGDYEDDVVRQFYPPEGGEPGIMLPWEKALGKVLLRPSELSLWAGINGHGKSQVVGQVALDAMRQGKRVCIASMELKPAILLKRLTRQAAAVQGAVPSIPYIRAIQRWFSESLWIFECVGNAKAEELLSVFKYAKKRYGIDLFIIDSMLKLGLGEDDYNGQKLITEQLCDFKNIHDCHVAMVCHSRKRESEREKIGKMDIRGSGAVADLADSIFTVWRNKGKEEAMQKGDFEGDIETFDAESADCLLGVDKQRNGEWEGRLALWFDPLTWQYTESSTRRVKRYVDFSEGHEVFA